jgi:hypothetical protein
MEEVIYNSNTVSASYLTNDKLIKLIWKEESTTSEYRTMFETIVDFAQKNKVRFLISDITKEGLVSFDDFKWLDEEILKEAVKLGVERIALINGDSIFSSVYADTIKRKLLNSPVKVQLFDDLASAKAWVIAE